MSYYTDLEVWQEAHKLTLLVYPVAQRFPKEEMFGLTSQVKRAVTSVEANLAEGYGRFSKTDFHRFCQIAHGSLMETECHLRVAHDLKFLPAVDWEALQRQIQTVARLLQGFMRYLRKPEPRP
jgi:four helix bundle protein